MHHYLNTPEILNRRLTQLLNRHDPELAGELRKKSIRIKIRPRLRWQDKYLLVLAAILLSLLLLASTTAKADEAWGMQFSEGDQLVDAVALSTSIEIEVIGSQARVEVLQSFHNQSDQWVEASYRFPLPDEAAVDQLKIEVGGRVLVGEIQEKQLAEKIYQQAKQNGQTTSLVRQEKDHQFHTKLANIGPGEVIKVKIGFLQPVLLADGQFRLRLPMTFTPSYNPNTSVSGENISSPHAAANNNDAPGQELKVSIDLMTDFELAELNSSYHAINVHETRQGYFIILENDSQSGHLQYADRDFELVWRLQPQDEPLASVLTWEDDNGFYAQLQLVPPATDFLDERPREVIFIIDTSGSMAGVPMHQARQALTVGLDQLRAEDRFNIIRFSSDAKSLFTEPQTATQSNLASARTEVSQLDADGGTNIQPALELALSNVSTDHYLQQIIFITDGAVGNESEIYQYLHEQLEDTRLFTVAIGAAPNSWFMRKAAEVGRGSYTHIGKLEEITERMVLLWQRISKPALEDVCIDWGQHAESYPAVIPDLYAGDSLFVTARLNSPITEVTVCGQLNGQGWEYTQPLPKQHANADIARLWARKKIETINDNQLLGLPFNEVREQILDVALQYGLLSRFTALVAVDPEPARSAAENLSRSEVASLQPKTMQLQLAQGSLGWQLQLLLGVIALLVSAGMFWRSGVGKND
ncbi:MAG: marine proteobacterial sortase target protein [Xanthomonadales bacterium]|nr:marine proteobacterial sortase target protein [Xanthomonadales bacterium]